MALSLVFVQELRVPALPLLGVVSPATGMQLVSALPLTALVGGPDLNGAAVVELSNVTLVVPVLDFLALLTLATDNATAITGVRRCMDSATLQQAADLRPGIQALQLGNASWTHLALAAYRGWGANASLLTLQPQTPVPASVTLRCGTALAPAPAAGRQGSSGGESSSSAPVGVIVGCVVGGTALLAITAVLAVLWQRRKSARDTRCEAGPAALLWTLLATESRHPARPALSSQAPRQDWFRGRRRCGSQGGGRRQQRRGRAL